MLNEMCLLELHDKIIHISKNNNNNDCVTFHTQHYELVSQKKKNCVQGNELKVPHVNVYFVQNITQYVLHETTYMILINIIFSWSLQFHSLVSGLLRTKYYVSYKT